LTFLGLSLIDYEIALIFRIIPGCIFKSLSLQ
ncbi:MAG: hypothetical protein ACI9UO_001951, partial [Nitrospinales bacterium]